MSEVVDIISYIGLGLAGALALILYATMVKNNKR